MMLFENFKEYLIIFCVFLFTIFDYIINKILTLLSYGINTAVLIIVVYNNRRISELIENIIQWIKFKNNLLINNINNQLSQNEKK